jgi:D-alanyl-D-alanine carboxypeptidase
VWLPRRVPPALHSARCETSRLDQDDRNENGTQAEQIPPDRLSFSEYDAGVTDSPSSRLRKSHPSAHSHRNRLIGVIAGIVIIAAAVAAVFLLRPSQPTTPRAAVTHAPSASPTSTPTPTPTATPTPTPTPFNKEEHSLTDPSSVWVLVNKRHPLDPKNYVPPLAPLNLPGVGGAMQPKAAKALQKMFAAYHAQSGAQLSVVSPYRSYNTQVSTYNGWVSRLGKAQADRQSARPGFSEHQTGLAVDIDTAINQGFGGTPAGKWLAQRSWKYGFIVRYPQGQEPVTGYEYEPWHFRYVGVALATEMHKTHAKSLEAFFGYSAAPTY